jgi:Dna[CI] antecedent, DciA
MQGMRDVLRGSLGRSLRELPDEDRLAAAWPVACGSALAGHGKVMHLDAERVLHVRVAGAEWMKQFVQVRSALANDLGRIAGVKLAGIHFEKSRD